MYIKALTLNNFRNIESCTVYFENAVNVIVGKNAQGKTNLLEAIYLLSGSKSFRGAAEREMVSFGKKSFFIGASFFDREENCKLSFGCDVSGDSVIKKSVVNEKAYKSQRALLGNAVMTVFSPDDLKLIKDGPSNRRNYCDSLLCMLFPSYVKTLSRYNRIVSQKNAVLKSGENLESLDIWNEQLSVFGASVIKSRYELIKRLEPHAKNVFSEMTDGKEELCLKYLSTACDSLEKSESEIAEIFKDKLNQNRQKEVLSGSCLYGPHRDDLEVFINKKSARQFCSQGQQRSCVLALLLSKTNLVTEITNKTPIVLLDDVMSELDSTRQEYLLSKIHNFQVLITCCQDDFLSSDKNYNILKVENGKIY